MKTIFSHTAHADWSPEIRKQRLMREAGLFDREANASPLHLSLLVAVVVTVLGGATALMDDGSLGMQVANAAKVTANR